MNKRCINDPELQRDIVKILIDRFHDMLAGLPGQTGDVSFRVINTRNQIGNDWRNEIHPNRDGFKRVASEYAKELKVQFPNLSLNPLAK